MQVPSSISPPIILHPITPSMLLAHGAGLVLSVLLGGVVRWLIDGSQMDTQLFGPLSRVGTEASRSLTLRPLRNAPSGVVLEPPPMWGEVRFVREDIWPDELTWEVGPHGIYIPAPRKLVSANLASEMSQTGTHELRFYEPPKGRSSGVYRGTQRHDPCPLEAGERQVQRRRQDQ